MEKEQFLKKVLKDKFNFGAETPSHEWKLCDILDGASIFSTSPNFNPLGNTDTVGRDAVEKIASRVIS